MKQIDYTKNWRFYKKKDSVKKYCWRQGQKENSAD